MSDNVPMGYSEPPTIDDIELEAMEHCVKYIVDNVVRFRYEGENNTMAWWDSKGNQGKELRSLVMLARGIVSEYNDEPDE